MKRRPPTPHVGACGWCFSGGGGQSVGPSLRSCVHPAVHGHPHCSQRATVTEEALGPFPAAGSRTGVQVAPAEAAGQVPAGFKRLAAHSAEAAAGAPAPQRHPVPKGFVPAVTLEGHLEPGPQTPA